ncbi:MAG: tail fiber protein [Bryobacteraceae bacterium]
MAEAFLGSLLLVPYNFAPNGWALCNGQIMSISQNAALFSLLGTTYGGDGVSTFALPDLRGRVPKSAGQAPGLANYVLGQTGGTENATLLASNMPAHNHHVNTVSSPGSSSHPPNQLLASSTGGSMYAAASAADSTLASNAISTSGGSLPFSILSPYLTLNWIIALTGIYPSRG